MNLKDEFISFHSRQNGKVTFAVNDHGHVTHIVKRVDLRLLDVFSRLQKIHSANLPIIFDVVEQADCLEVHEEYIRGKTVEQLRRETGVLDDATLLDVAIDVCSALVSIHGTEPPIVHRDVKPGNIMQREDGGYVLIDFDAARIYREDACTDTKCIATVGYAAPEQYGLSQTDVRSDLFSLGVTLYELKTGEAYHVGAKCDGFLKSIIAKCTAFEPKKRFQSAKQLLTQLKALQPEKKRSVTKSRICFAVLLCTTLIASFCAVYFGMVKNNRQESFVPIIVSAASASSELPALSTFTDAPAPTASVAYEQDIPCTCDFRFAVLTSDKGLIIPFDGETPVTVQLKVEGEFAIGDCRAQKHMESVELVACHINQTTAGAKADITEGGSMTVYTEGVYCVDGFIKKGDEISEIVSAVLLVTHEPEAYTDCCCIFNTEKSFPVFDARQVLPSDGSPLYLDLCLTPYYEDRLCTANNHKKYIPLMGSIDDAPEGANCGVTEDNRFYTDTAGVYRLRMPSFYDGKIYNFGCDVTVSELDDHR